MLKRIKKIPIIFSIVVTFIMMYQGGAKSTNFVFLNYLFASGIFTYIFLEYLSSDIKSKIRILSLWASAFMILIIFSTRTEAEYLQLALFAGFLISFLVLYIYIFLEYMHVKSYIRIFSLWVSAFMSLPFIFMNTNPRGILFGLGFLLAISSPLLLIALIVLSFFEEPDPYPIIFGSLSVGWLMGLLGL